MHAYCFSEIFLNFPLLFPYRSSYMMLMANILLFSNSFRYKSVSSLLCIIITFTIVLFICVIFILTSFVTQQNSTEMGNNLSNIFMAMLI